MTRPYSDRVARLSFATAYPALLLMAATMATGPWNVLRRRRNPVSTDLRRDIGWWAGLLALVHTGFGQNVHLRGRPWLYYVYQKGSQHLFPLRHDRFGFSNETGALATIAVVVLLATSNDYALRHLGTPRWKALQRLNYAALALAAAHTIAYQWDETRIVAFKVLAAVSIATAGFLQAIGFLRRRAEKVHVKEPAAREC